MAVTLFADKTCCLLTMPLGANVLGVVFFLLLLLPLLFSLSPHLTVLFLEFPSRVHLACSLKIMILPWYHSWPTHTQRTRTPGGEAPCPPAKVRLRQHRGRK